MKNRISITTLLILSLCNVPLLAASPEQDQSAVGAAGQETAGSETGDVLGARTGYIHPFLSIDVMNSDNISNRPDNKLDDWSIIYSPGIWLATPAKRDIFLDLNTSNTSPGGRFQQLDSKKAFSRIQAYALYAAHAEEYQSETELNNVKQAAEGSIQFNMRGGLSLNVFDKYTDSEDPIGTGDSTVVDKFTNNLLGAAMNFEITEKFGLRADYNHFYLDYDLPVSKNKSRVDDAYALFFKYNYSPKTLLFMQYEYIDVSYDTNSIQDSAQHYLYAGLGWRPSEKTTFRGKLGYTQRDSDNPAASSENAPVLELAFTHNFTVKTGVDFFASHKLNESTVSTAAYSKDTIVRLSLNKIITEKVSARLLIDYTEIAFEGNTGAARTDDFYTISPGFRYRFREWLEAEAVYKYWERDSNVDAFDFETNSFFLRLSAGF